MTTSSFKKSRLTVLLTVLVFVVLGGCGLLNFEPMVESRVDEHGNNVFLDTPERWFEWRQVVRPQIDTEIVGYPSPGYPSWNKKWSSQFKALIDHQENASKYIDYIIERRRDAGLPEINTIDEESENKDE